MRREVGFSQNDLARKLQLAGWDVDRVLIAKIENRYRTLTDHEILLLLRVMGREPKDIGNGKDFSLSEWYKGNSKD